MRDSRQAGHDHGQVSLYILYSRLPFMAECGGSFNGLSFLTTDRLAPRPPFSQGYPTSAQDPGVEGESAMSRAAMTLMWRARARSGARWAHLLFIVFFVLCIIVLLVIDY